MKPVYLLTGRPGTGKTSLIKQAVTGHQASVGGFYTEEIRTGGIRQGFKLVTLDGNEVVFAHVDFPKKFRVGKYGVDIDIFKSVGVNAIVRALEQNRTVVIDEIGKMELFSDDFREVLLKIIAEGRRMLATIMLKSHPFADIIRQDAKVDVVPLTRDNFQKTLSDVQIWLRA